MKNITKIAAGLIATFFWAGYFPFAPGTFASLEASLIYALVGRRLPLFPYLLVLAALFLAGTAASDTFARLLKQKDPRPIVIDEIVGQGVALLFIPAGWAWIAGAFFLFRLFDVLKPWPIRALERLPGGWGIMADDVAAGAVSALVLMGIRLVL
ncbi:MAG: phosphatidylglycerophosphatase A [Candidatus Aminicenantes bacterium]|nr:phosphatidylglycerophosphatase A [Candidatus Aminicenantes bacterium]